MKLWPLAASAVILLSTAGCKTVVNYGNNPPGGGTPGQHPWAAQWTPPAPPAPPAVAPAPAPAPVAVTPPPAPVAAPIEPPPPPPVPVRRAPRRERG